MIAFLLTPYSFGFAETAGLGFGFGTTGAGFGFSLSTGFGCKRGSLGFSLGTNLGLGFSACFCCCLFGLSPNLSPAPQPDAEVVLLACLLRLAPADDLALAVLYQIVPHEPAGRLFQLAAPHAQSLRSARSGRHFSRILFSK